MKVFTITTVVFLLMILALGATASPRLVPIAQSSSMIWNAVAVVAANVYVAGPRWAGSFSW
ncbi:MAG: hypothetical protein WAK31_27380 [Chthoniobacterales bacterium]